jgi:hypothetical protein
MISYFKFYLPVNNPTGLSGIVGGSISTNELKPYVNLLFAPMPSFEDVSISQYRKVYIRQIESGVFNNLYVELANVEYPTQVSFVATGELISGETSISPLSPPNSFSGNGVFSGNYNTYLYLASESAQHSSFPIWIKQTIPSGAGSDNLASFSLKVRATKNPYT